MTALAYTLAPEPELDFFEGDEVFAPQNLRPNLRLVAEGDRVAPHEVARAEGMATALARVPQGDAGRRARPASSLGSRTAAIQTPTIQTVAQLAAQSASQLAARRAAAAVHASAPSTAAARPVAAPTRSVEVYRRRQFLVLAAVTMLVLGLAWAAGVSVLSFGPATAPADDPITAVAPAVHVVMPGETYAAIAAELGASDPVAAGEQLRVANGGSELVIGQRLLINPQTLGQSA